MSPYHAQEQEMFFIVHTVMFFHEMPTKLKYSGEKIYQKLEWLFEVFVFKSLEKKVSWNIRVYFDLSSIIQHISTATHEDHVIWSKALGIDFF